MSAWNRARPKHLTEYAELLEMIHSAAQRQGETIIPVEGLADYRVREVLAACSRYPAEAGQFAGLDKRVQLQWRRVEDRTMLVITSRGFVLAAEAEPDEELVADLARQMREAANDPSPMHARPSAFDRIRRGA